MNRIKENRVLKNVVAFILSYLSVEAFAYIVRLGKSDSENFSMLDYGTNILYVFVFGLGVFLISKYRLGLGHGFADGNAEGTAAFALTAADARTGVLLQRPLPSGRQRVLGRVDAFGPGRPFDQFAQRRLSVETQLHQAAGMVRPGLDERFGPGEKQIWGEPWAGGECHPIPGTALAHKAHMRRLSPAIGAFCDDTRDAVKGSVMDEMSRGFVNGGGLSAERLACCTLGWAGDCGDFARPSQTITYLSSHDDWTLWDKLVSTLDPKRDFTGCGEKVLRANRLAFAILAGCQGHLFMLSGEEFGRTKQGVKNSYCSPLSINAMDWQRSCKNAALTDYYRGLIALRKRLPALTDKSANAGGRLICVRQLAQDAAALLLDNGPDSNWSQLVLAVNASDAAVEFNLPAGEWAVLADGESSFLWQKPASLSGRATIQPMSAMYLGLTK